MYKDYVLERLEKLLSIPSPTGMTTEAISYLKEEFEALGLETTLTRKGALYIKLKGEISEKTALVASHTDTLGAMVRSIESDGNLTLVPIGGLPFTNVEAENLLIHTREGKTIEGTLMPKKSSVHVHGKEVQTTERTRENVRVRIDEEVNNKEDVKNLGIEVGDFVSFDNRYRMTESGYIKSRFLDDKVCCIILLAALKELVDEGVTPKHDIHFLISDYEEVGHGVYNVPESVVEVISLDIGVVDPKQNTDEKSLILFAKDGRTPYDQNLLNEMIELCKKEHIDYLIDVVDNYASDATASLSQGRDVRFACIGPGVESTHHYERTHVDAIENSIKFIKSYVRAFSA